MPHSERDERSRRLFLALESWGDSRPDGNLAISTSAVAMQVAVNGVFVGSDGSLGHYVLDCRRGKNAGDSRRKGCLGGSRGDYAEARGITGRRGEPGFGWGIAGFMLEVVDGRWNVISLYS
ncbi:hypothetical protein BDV59DRAFT_169574 [Aspergillus ambiguus]|uniref:uncharacterized protein n=1 Tax=Aspergillus ambiguus TaxID=176160 RepID=UPI003CCE1091